MQITKVLANHFKPFQASYKYLFWLEINDDTVCTNHCKYFDTNPAAPGVGGVAVLLAVPYLLVDVLLGLLLLAAAAGLHGGAHADQEGRGDAVAAKGLLQLLGTFYKLFHMVSLNSLKDLLQIITVFPCKSS